MQLPKRITLPKPGAKNRNVAVPSKAVNTTEPERTPFLPIDQLDPRTFMAHHIQYDLIRQGI